MSKRIDKETEKQIINDYNTNATGKSLYSKYNISRNTLYVILERNGVKPNKNIQHIYNNDIFSNVNSESAYWLGVLFTDGCIVHVKDKGARIVLNTKDKEHLEEFVKFLDIKPSLDVKTRTHIDKLNNRYYSYVVTFNNNQIANDIEGYGYNTEKPSKEIINNIDFWRGVIDGDGCISVKNERNYLSVGMCGSFNLCDSFLRFCSQHHTVNTHVNKIKNKNAWQCQINGKIAEEIVKLLYYPNCKYYLKRKMERIKLFFETGRCAPYLRTNYENFKKIDFLPPKSKENLITLQPEPGRESQPEASWQAPSPSPLQYQLAFERKQLPLQDSSCA